MAINNQWRWRNVNGVMAIIKAYGGNMKKWQQ
jgi:hypothetical protein